MNIILVSDKSVQATNITLTKVHFVLVTIVLVAITLSLALGLNYLSLRYADKVVDNAVLRALVVSPQQERQLEIQANLHDNLNSMAAKLGQMQAKLLRLDTLGERLAESTGVDSQEFLFKKIPGQGGALPSLPTQDISYDEFSRELHSMSHILDDRADKLEMIDSLLRHDRLAKEVLPSVMPINKDWFSSGFGYRIDPFTGRRAFHKGVDFPAKTGTPIKASASGVVIYSDRHRDYGNMVEIDHGNGLVSRYAHASKRLVKLGQIVLSGQKIAEVGSTGRSTGPHLHFEIRRNGIPQNPSQFLKRPG